MAHAFPIPNMIALPGNNVCLRLVDVRDAPFILRLRLSPRGRYLSPVEDDVQTQKDWIRNYKVREAAGAEYYFVVHHTTAGDVGTVRVYDIDGDSFWWGSWILDEHAPKQAALECVVVLFDWCFFRMSLRRVRAVVRKNNQTCIDFNRRFGQRIVREDALNVFFEMTRDEYAHTKRQLELQGVIGRAGVGPRRHASTFLPG